LEPRGDICLRVVLHYSAPQKLGGEPYALLFDRTQLLLGEKQRYGTQVRHDFLGMPMAAPVEDPERIDALRAAAGLMPLKDYLRLFGGGGTVRISPACGADPVLVPETPADTARKTDRSPGPG
jgi:hypothetical protein